MRDLKHLIFFEDLLQDANNALVQQACAQGKLALAYNCSYIPEVLLDVEGCFGIRLRAPGCTNPDLATYYMTNRSCPYSKSILERAYDRAKEKLLALPQKEYTEFLAAQAGNAAVTGREQIVINGQDRSMGEAIVRGANEIAAKRGLPAGLTLSPETGDFSGGLKLRDGSVEVNCTVDTLLSLSRNRLDAEIAAILFD